MHYNTKRESLTMPEYGRHIQQMVKYVKTIEDPEKRQKNAQSIIELMGVLNPHLKNVEDFRHKLWDHLFLIADFELDVASPYPIPTRDTLTRKVEKLPYPNHNLAYRHLGKNILTVIDKALQEEDAEKRKGFTNSIAYYMKLSYHNWHKEQVHDDNIKEELNEITSGALSYSGDGNQPRFNTRFDNNRNHHKKFSNNRPGVSGNNSNRSGGFNNRGSNNSSQSGGGGNYGNKGGNNNNNTGYNKNYKQNRRK